MQIAKTTFLLLFPFYSYRFTQIVVDAQIKTPGGKTYDVIFVGTGKSSPYIRITKLIYKFPNKWKFLRKWHK